ncbi:Lysophospholipase nte1 [Cyphellophora attinorum]|uniref:Lysophospholipase NTE1 n=1 Tax=Cyphellophora attinorum TaxID=1664694 RepID=A0A0N1HF20_9EURO|nr:Lysophospholipase nte1 [Phialophora attinorum]KPI44220.1 Lysophospholipase nte1 [Phialophora attinorum]
MATMNAGSVPSARPPHPTQNFVPTPANASAVGDSPSTQQKSLVTLLVLLIAVLAMVPGTVLQVFRFLTISLPAWLFHLFSMSLTFTMNFTTLLLIAVALVSTVSWFVRYRFLNVYARLPQESSRKEAQIDLFPDTQDGDSKPGLSNYLDEFLSAIKVFGYLERPVFHELTRTMQTRKLMAGETLLLEEEKGFCMVVDGLVQIFVKSLQDERTEGGRKKPQDDDEGYHEGNQGYQLLTEVKNGASMSSLFSILSLFTEDISLRREDSGEQGRPYTPDSAVQTPGNTAPSTPALQQEHNPFHDAHGAAAQARLSRVPPLSLEPPFNDHKARRGASSPQSAPSAHPDIVARALVDTTIAIIPASAFRRLTKVYPKATAHIVQVILTRLQRVTFSTAHQYLGLTSELLQIEKLMNKYTNFDLPGHLRGTALDRLRDKFSKERERLGDEDITQGIALHNPTTSRRRSSSSMRKEAALAARVAASRLPTSTNGSLPGTMDDKDKISAGDLASNAQAARTPARPGSMSFGDTKLRDFTAPDTFDRATSPLQARDRSTFRPTFEGSVQRQDAASEDAMFRESIMQSMVKALGLSEADGQNGRRVPASVEQSPRMVSFDAKRQTAVFNNAFGFIDALDGSADGDTESITASLASLSQGRNLNDELIDDVEVVFFPKGSVLVEQGERNPGLYYVIDGFLDVSIPVDEKEERSGPRPPTVSKSSRNAPPHLRRAQTSTSRKPSMPGYAREPKQQVQKSLFLVKPGGMAGYVGTLSSYRSFTDVTAKTDVYVGFLPRSSIERVIERFPLVLLTMAKRLTSLLPRLILHIDFALEWVQVNAGQVIHHQGDESDAIYIVLNGRLRAVKDTPEGGMRVYGEYGQGESIGELEVMTEETRPATLHAIRDTELAKLPKTLFNSLAQEHPSITIQISKLIAQRMRALVEEMGNERSQEKKRAALGDSSTSTMNLRTITILPVTAGVPVTDFGNRLLAAFSQVSVAGGVTLLNQSIVLNHLGRHAFSRMGRLKLTQYLADLEERYGMFLLGMKTTSRKELVLLHLERYSPPGLTRRWLRNRVWINGDHHHIQMAFRTTAEATPHSQPRRFGNAIKHRVQVLQAEIQKYTSRRIRQTPLYSTETPFKGDLHRLARRLCGRSVGLVLGGGGARGIAHVGIIRALEEAGIPIDIIGGTSIGAFIGALYARDADVVPMFGRAKKFAGRMGSMWRFALDLTYPTASYTTGHEFNRGIFKTFGESQIEDFWLSFYCNTTNISKSRPEIHTSGYAWRYVRASMSLAGLIPPMCDEGAMLLDGGYIDNLTVAHMKSLGADLVFAVDVGSLDDDTPQQFGDSLSGFWMLLNRWNPFSSVPNPPSLSDIQARLAYVSSVDALERAKNTPGVLYMRPPVDAYGTLDFGKFDEICELGYQYGREFLGRLKNEGELPRGWGGEKGWGEDESEEGRGLRRTMAPRRASI